MRHSKSTHPSYLAVLATFARNSLVRDMTFRGNFLIECVTSLVWMTMNLYFYMLIFQFTQEIGSDTGWSKFPFLVFLATTMLVNSLVQTFIMPNAAEFSELIRMGNLDFALLKPIDTQFLISFQKIQWSSLSNFFFGTALLAYSLARLNHVPGVIEVVLYPVYIVTGVAIMYSLMICLAATSVWMGRNQTLYDFWFYITTFSRYPIEIYKGGLGRPFMIGFTFVVPILIVANVPARFLAKPLQEGEWYLTGYAAIATIASLYVSRQIFRKALVGYRSASS